MNNKIIKIGIPSKGRLRNSILKIFKKNRLKLLSERGERDLFGFIKGYENIITIEPERIRLKPTLNKQQKLFHFLQRSVASKGYYETVTWSFTDSKINQLFREDYKEVQIVNPISSDLDVLRNSIFPNLIFYLKKNLDRGFKDISLFEIGPIFQGKQPGQQLTVIGGLRSG